MSFYFYFSDVAGEEQVQGEEPCHCHFLCYILVWSSLRLPSRHPPVKLLKSASTWWKPSDTACKPADRESMVEHLEELLHIFKRKYYMLWIWEMFSADLTVIVT